jgi:hypothetical protein
MDDLNPLETIVYINLKSDARKFSSTTTKSPLNHNAEHGNLLATAKLNGDNFICHGRHPSLTSTQFAQKMEFLWGVHNTCLLTRNKALKFPMCGHSINYGHMAGN